MNPQQKQSDEERTLETIKNFSDWLQQIECELLEVTYTLGSLDRVCEESPELLEGYEQLTADLNAKLDKALDEVRLLMKGR